MSTEDPKVFTAGWQVRLTGDNDDLVIWERELSNSSEARVFRGQQGEWLLASDVFSGSVTHHAVRGQAIELVNALNLRMAMSHATLPAHISTVTLIHPDGTGQNFHVSGGGVDNRGQPPARAPTKAQHRALPKGERISGLLSQLEKAHTWDSIYRTLELAEELVGKGGKLEKLLGSKARRYREMRSHANAYRHTMTDYDPGTMDIAEAGPFLRLIVRVALANAI